MNDKPKAEPARAKGLFRNGKRWWLRVRDPLTGEARRCSTGTEDLRVANSIEVMVDELALDRVFGWDWLQDVVAGRVALMDLYNYRVRFALHTLRERLNRERIDAADVDLRELVRRWLTDVLPTSVTRRGTPLSEHQRNDYERQVRALIPDDVPTRCSSITEDYLRATLKAVGGKPNTQRNYVTAWRVFLRWARRNGAPIQGDPFEYESEWVPRPSRPRNKAWSHAERLAVLAEMKGAAKAAVALMLGSGMELSAIFRLRGKDVSHDGSRTVFADGTKTDYRSRYVTVDAWAWPLFTENIPHVIGEARVFPWAEESKGNALRDAFYWAQVRAGMCPTPPKSQAGQDKWGAVEVHTLHDCRRTYAICRGLGLDGEKPQDTMFLASQLGHANEAMVQRCYKHLSPARRTQLLAEAAKLKASG